MLLYGNSYKPSFHERLVGRIEFSHKVGPLKMVVSQYMFIEDLFMNKVEPIGSMSAIYGNIWGILMVYVTIYTIHGSYGESEPVNQQTRASKTLS